MKKKLLILGGVLIVIFVVSVIFIFNYDKDLNNNDNNMDTNNDNNTEMIESNITKDQNINGIIFTNITCEFNGSVSVLEYTIVNNTNEVVNLGEYEIIVKDNNGNAIANMVGFLEQDIQPNEEVMTGNTINIDLNEADSIELVLD